MILKRVIFYSFMSLLSLAIFGQNKTATIQIGTSNSNQANLRQDIVDLPIAHGLSKFLGSAYSANQSYKFEKYWNQVTPENASKWGAVESTRDIMNWYNLDDAYNFARAHNFPFKLHCMIWGNQQPEWIKSLDSTQQRQEIEEWFQLAAERYDSVNMVEIVNEPLNDPPSKNDNGGGNYINALGGNGETGWDWVIESFRIGRKYFNDTVVFMLNDFNIVGDLYNTMQYLEIVKLLKADTLIDAIGIQCHAFSTIGRSQETLKQNLDSLATAGLPIYATELDIDGPDDATQLANYQKVFKVIWEHPAVAGITLWGYKPGLWRNAQKAYILNVDGSERPALQWLKAYVRGTYVPMSAITVTSEGNIDQISDDNGTLQMIANILPDSATLEAVTWSVDSSSIATISSTGLLTAKKNGVVVVKARSMELESTVNGTMQITVAGQISSIEDNEMQSVEIYPNPVKDGKLTVKMQESVSKIKIMDVRGVVVFEQNCLNNNELQLDLDVSPGIYIVQFVDGNKYAYRKIMVE